MRLTPLTVSDAEALLAVYADPAMFEFTGGSVPTLDQLRDRLGSQTDATPEGTDWLNWVVRAGDEVVGVTQATVKEHGALAEVAWEIGVPWQGRGYAAEAATAVVDWLTAEGVPDIRAHIHPDHTASARVARAAGLEPTDEWIGGEVMWALPGSSLGQARQ
ncbi:MAG: GNAT family N-acetyltransferase [Acidimicrobiales bacterium]